MANDLNLPILADSTALSDPEALRLLVETELGGKDVPGLTVLSAPTNNRWCLQRQCQTAATPSSTGC